MFFDMPRSLVLGNGKTLIGLDRYAQVRDLYFPYVGLEDQVRGHYVHKIGVWIDGRLSWFEEDGEWQFTVTSKEESLGSDVKALHPTLNVSLSFHDVVYNEKSIFVRNITVKNLLRKSREIKLYIGHQFELYKSHSADTGYFDPVRHALIHYKGRRVFLMNGEIEGVPFSDYTVGLVNYQDKVGSHRDAEDGVLAKNPIEHGPVDSVMGFYGFYTGEEEKSVYYWMVGATSIPEALALNSEVLKKTPEHILKSTTDFWQAWVNKYNFSFYSLTPDIIKLFKRSLMIVRAHADDGGAILASGDSDMLHQGKDTYAYMWPRDGAYSAIALDRSGDTHVARRFFEFCKGVISNEGYFMHKYLPDQSLGSSWHPYIRDGQYQLPIQEDETALVIWAIYEHYKQTKDVEFVEALYNEVIEKAADFMVMYRDSVTKLPKASYDLWEEKYGTTTFTSSAVYGALTAAAHFAKLLGKTESEARYTKAAEEIKAGMLKYLYHEDRGYFIKLITINGKEVMRDETLDASSVFGIFSFGVLSVNDPILVKAIKVTEEGLSRNISIKGLARYEGDNYYRAAGDTPGNPWIITTLWLAQYYIAQAQTEKEFGKVRDILTWVTRYAMPSGVLSEQLHPHSGEQISAAPLTWSHAEYVNTVICYLNRLEELGYCKACNPAS